MGFLEPPGKVFIATENSRALPPWCNSIEEFRLGERLESAQLNSFYVSGGNVEHPGLALVRLLPWSPSATCGAWSRGVTLAIGARVDAIVTRALVAGLVGPIPTSLLRKVCDNHSLAFIDELS